MDNHIFRFHISPDELPDCETELLRLQKRAQKQPSAEIQDQMAGILALSENYLEMKAGYCLFDQSRVAVGPDTISCDRQIFNTQATIAGQLAGSSRLAFFAVTLGPSFDGWIRQYFNDGDPFGAYVADLIGSIRADQAADWLETKISLQAAVEQLKCTNRFSPGYCGWHVSEQHRMFSLFPAQFLGISLTPSALMTPLKSISGVIGIGDQVEKLPYTCEFCEQEECFMRR